jgi:glycosyltransferase involved in cell wall biosynthesis
VAASNALRDRLWADDGFKRVWTYCGVDLWPVIRDTLTALWAWELRQGIRYLVLAERLIADIRPQVVIVASETSLDNKALIAVARHAGIPVVAAQHGSIPPTDDYLVDFSADPADFSEGVSKELMFPDRFCISGESTRRTLVEQVGYAFPDRLVTTGQSRFDPLFSPSRHFNRDRFCRAFGVDGRKRIVVVGTQTFHIAGNREQFARAVLGALRTCPDITVLIKPHVIERPGFYRGLIRELGIDATVLPASTSMQEALFACDLLITFYSTIAVEAMVLGRPVVTVNLTGAPDPLPFAREGAAIGVYHEEDIADAIRRALDDPETRQRMAEAVRRFLPKEIGAEDGRATQRILSLAGDLARDAIPRQTTHERR